MSMRILENIGTHHYIGNYVVPEVDFLISRAYSAAKEFNQTGNKSAFLKVLLVANQIKCLAAQYNCWGETGGNSPASTMWGNRNLIGEAILYAFSDFFMDIENKTVITKINNEAHNPKNTGIAELNYTSHLDNLLKKYRHPYFKIYDIDYFVRRGWNSSERYFKELGFMPFDLGGLLPQEIYKRMYACLKCFNDLISSEIMGFDIFLHMAKKKETSTIAPVSLTLDNRFGNWTDTNFSHLPIYTHEFPQEEILRIKSIYFHRNDQQSTLIYDTIVPLTEEYRLLIEERIKNGKYGTFKAVEDARQDMAERMMGRVRLSVQGTPYLYEPNFSLPKKWVFHSLPEMALLEADYLLKDMVKRN